MGFSFLMRKINYLDLKFRRRYKKGANRHASFNPRQIVSNWLSAVLFGVKCFVYSHNYVIKVFCDNSTAVAYINNLGGMVPSLHAVSKSIWEWCFAHHCLIEAYHISGSSNIQAD